jgi:hypothetical protein
MKTIVILSLCSLATFASAALDVFTLDELKWKNRIVITLTNDGNLNESLQQELKENDVEINDRDILYFLISPTAILSNRDCYLSLEDMGDLIQTHFDKDDLLKVLLIGKDGGVKMETDSLDLEYLFRLIDSMPMRQQEMKSR